MPAIGKAVNTDRTERTKGSGLSRGTKLVLLGFSVYIVVAAG